MIKWLDINEKHTHTHTHTRQVVNISAWGLIYCLVLKTCFFLCLYVQVNYYMCCEVQGSHWFVDEAQCPRGGTCGLANLIKGKCQIHIG